MHGVFITGTSTEVGKTFVAAEIARVRQKVVGIPFGVEFLGFTNLVTLLEIGSGIPVRTGDHVHFAVAVEIGVVMLVYLNQAYRRHEEKAHREQRNVTPSELRGAVVEGALLRVRPIMMTVAAIIAGLLPIMLGGGTGSEVMRRIAAPIPRVDAGPFIDEQVDDVVVPPVNGQEDRCA